MENIREILLKLCKIRNGIPQLVFIHQIYPVSYFELRSCIIKFKKENPDCKEIDFILQSMGGYADDAYRIIRTLRKSFETVNVIIPQWAKSAATLLSLGGSVIVMDEGGEFGPLDAQIAKTRDDSPQIDRESALNDQHSVNIIESRYKEMYESMYIRIYEHSDINIPKSEVSRQLLEQLSKFYEPLLKQINPYKLGEKRRVLDIGSQYAEKILILFGPEITDENKSKLVDYLVNGCPDHGFVIDYDVMSQFLSNVKTSQEFGGDEYKILLQELSLLFFKLFELAEDTYAIEFIINNLNDTLNAELNSIPLTTNTPKLNKINKTNGKFKSNTEDRDKSKSGPTRKSTNK